MRTLMQAAAAAAEPKLKFRNYAPRDEKIKGEEVAPPLVKPFEAPTVEPEEYNPDDNEASPSFRSHRISIITTIRQPTLH